LTNVYNHEKHWPKDAHKHHKGCASSIYLERPGVDVRVRSWVPSIGKYHGYMITHPEVTTIANFLTIKQEDKLMYRPTVHYAYCPCPNALLSIVELNHREWLPQTEARLLIDEISDGMDELGILLMGNVKGAYWYGSRLSIHDARQRLSENNATSLQVVAGIISGMIWALEHPNEGIVEPEDLDHEFILHIAAPYLGEVGGYYTQWDPLEERNLYPQACDSTDSWQFKNIHVES
jgi:homospermidine synthase